MNLKKTLIPVIGAIIIFAGGFGTGMYYQKKHTTTATVGQFNESNRPTMPDGTSGGTPPTGQNGSRTGGPGGGMTSGEIISKTDTSLTIKTSDGSTKTIYYSDSTTVSKNETGALSDLTVGTNISVNGTTNTDKSVTSKMIMITPKSE